MLHGLDGTVVRIPNATVIAEIIVDEYAARHALMLAVHRASDAAGVSIAFPQLVVW